MKIHNKEFRIVEETFGDGHKEFHAEYCYLNLIFFKFPEDNIYDYCEYGYGSISYKYRFKIYKKCLEYLTYNVEEKLKIKNDKRITNINIFK